MRINKTHRTTRQLLDMAAQDSDKVSAFALGSHWGDSDGAIFVVKGGMLAHTLYAELVTRGLITAGKPVVDP
jgi:hypothetical protein